MMKQEGGDRTVGGSYVLEQWEVVGFCARVGLTFARAWVTHLSIREKAVDEHRCR